MIYVRVSVDGSTYVATRHQITKIRFSRIMGRCAATDYKQLGLPVLTKKADTAIVPGGLMVRIRRFHRRGRGSIPRLGNAFLYQLISFFSPNDAGRH